MSENSNKMLSRAIRIAAEAHEGQIDKSNNLYIFHPLRVMLSVGSNKDIMSVAVLHDVLEDSSLTSLDLVRFQFSDAVIESVNALTRDSNRESYDDFIQRVLKDRWACIVKMKDIQDNTSIFRLQQLEMKDMKRLLAKYEKAKYTLWEAYVEACYKEYGKVL